MTGRLYGDLAGWWPAISPPSEYAEEAALYVETIRSAATAPVHRVLKLGSGGGNNASHMKHAFAMTLVEPADGMRELSRALNPECEHLPGDMRTVRLGRLFDAVFVHDAVMYMTAEEDLRAALATVAAHLASGGVALVAPDATTETFSETTEHGGGEDANGRRARYLEWRLPPESPARPPSRCTTRSSCAGRTGPCAPPTMSTARACSGARRGWGSSARSGSQHSSRPGPSRAASTTPLSRPGPPRRPVSATRLDEKAFRI